MECKYCGVEFLDNDVEYDGQPWCGYCNAEAEREWNRICERADRIHDADKDSR